MANNKPTWDTIGRAFADKSVLSADRATLEDYLMVLATVQVLSGPNQQRAHQMGETIRLLLARKDSQEAHHHAMVVSIAALIVSFAALVLAAIKAT